MATISRLRWIAVAGLLLATTGSGCRILDRKAESMDGSHHHHSAKATNPQGQLIATWSNRVGQSPDPTRGGAMGMGLAGRVYYFPPKSEVPKPLTGTVVVQLFDHTQVNKGVEPKLMEEWRLDPGTLKKLEKPDTFGIGYTLFLPWGSYRPDVAKVYLQVRHECGDGSGEMAPGSTLSLDHSVNRPVWQAAGRTSDSALGIPPPPLSPVPNVAPSEQPNADGLPPLKLPLPGVPLPSEPLPSPRRENAPLPDTVLQNDR
ncbi:hypothetical protein [Tuwongella immobilis]|uniref:Lipoprotein n=1 Tax=Tuwongella immobilis TaxID=692036 RepID=A0A6C2YSP7_9BACT|nr:hypothetical protein [Tuwongella immobilis]VIP04401.1 unnamed protein product [Tuwongella immobilis]VTS06164.1 unnamed protein product [Tuwongella immobilis]